MPNRDRSFHKAPEKAGGEVCGHRPLVVGCFLRQSLYVTVHQYRVDIPTSWLLQEVSVTDAPLGTPRIAWAVANSSDMPSPVTLDSWANTVTGVSNRSERSAASRIG